MVYELAGIRADHCLHRRSDRYWFYDNPNQEGGLMASLKSAFTEALLILKCNGKGRVMRAGEDFVEVDYQSTSDMLSDAQQLFPLGYLTRMNRKMATMQITLN